MHLSRSKLTLNKDAPCWANMMTCMVALSPILGVYPAGSGTCGKQISNPGYGSFDGPFIPIFEIMVSDMFGGIVPMPILM